MLESTRYIILLVFILAIEQTKSDFSGYIANIRAMFTVFKNKTFLFEKSQELFINYVEYWWNKDNSKNALKKSRLIFIFSRTLFLEE